MIRRRRSEWSAWSDLDRRITELFLDIVIEIPIALIHDEDAVAQLLTATDIHPNRGIS